jgi:hypothetical protein
MTIAESRAHEFIRLKLEFNKPMKATNTAEFTFKSDGPQTVVTWTMTGKANFARKAIGLLMNLDKMIGCQFEEGMANLKSLSEAAAGH